MNEVKSADDLIAEALQRRSIKQSAEAAHNKKQELRYAKALDKLAKARMKKLSAFWWLGAFGEKVKLAQDLAIMQTSLNDYKEHCANQAKALVDLYRWALAHDPEDGSLDTIKKMLGPIQTPYFKGDTL